MDALFAFEISVGILLLLSAVDVSGVDHQLPSFIKPCARNNPKFNECVKEHAGPVIRRLKDGIPGYDVPPMDPLHVKEILVDSNGLGISMQSFNVLIHGLSNSIPLDTWISKISPPSFKWHLFTPRVEIHSNYEVNGRVLLLPIIGKGDLNITISDVDYTYSFDCDLEKRDDGKEYLVPKSSNIEFKSSRTYTSLSNLFNGNKVLGDEMNYFLNENWEEIQKEFGPPIAEALAKAIRKIVTAITNKAPFDVIFPKTL